MNIVEPLSQPSSAPEIRNKIPASIPNKVPKKVPATSKRSTPKLKTNTSSLSDTLAKKPGEGNFTYGKRLFYAKKYQKAVERFEKVVRENPGHAIAYRRLGDAYLKLGKSKSAVKAWEQFLQRSSDSRGQKKYALILRDINNAG